MSYLVPGDEELLYLMQLQSFGFWHHKVGEGRSNCQDPGKDKEDPTGAEQSLELGKHQQVCGH